MIEVKNVTKKYGSTIAVDNINFTVNDGEVVGFLGPNGAGKSTTMNMITGFIEPTKGQIVVNGIDISKRPRKAKKEIGYMPENVPLYSELTAKEFLSYMAELKLVKRNERKKEVEKVLKEMGLEDVKNKLIRNLSRGYKQRVSLGGALIGDPDVIILDEPTVGLDPKQITEIRNLIKKLGEKHTVILSTHILSEVSQICEKVIIINKGKLIAIDTPENLEKTTREQNGISVTVEDPKNNMNKLKNKIKEIDNIELVKDNEDGTKQYVITTASDIDLRKKLFEILPKEEIVIFELKKTETTLEEAFIKLIDTVKQDNSDRVEKHNKKLRKENENVLNNDSNEKQIKKTKKSSNKENKEENAKTKKNNNKKEEKK